MSELVIAEMAPLDELQTKLATATEKNQLSLIAEIAGLGATGLPILQNFLAHPPTTVAIWVLGRAYEVLLQSEDTAAQTFVQSHFPTGIVPLSSAMGVDYTQLQHRLARHQFEAADQLTLVKMCELAGPTAVKRKWIYFSEVDGLPVTDLQTLNQLWLAHSEGKFGFSVQRQLWLSLNKNWDIFWEKIAWRSGKTWTRYPKEFIWDLTAPKGHLPLTNQLRGQQVINSLLNHPAWQ
jgi:GUN4-like/ARM-like repeat domain, GUN4-N terminal